MRNAPVGPLAIKAKNELIRKQQDEIERLHDLLRSIKTGMEIYGHIGMYRAAYTQINNLCTLGKKQADMGSKT